MSLGTATVIRGNALNLPLPSSSMDLICTSPPYFGLRSYQDAGAHYTGQIGSEVTPAEFLEALLAATREMVRVLKPSGSIFVNLGDKYNSAASGQNGTGDKTSIGAHPGSNIGRGAAVSGMRPKSLMGIPWRYAIACIDQLGLILRAEIIWNKPNGLPESVTDRVRRSHEQWFHFTKQPRYFAAVDEIREPHTGPGVEHFGNMSPEAIEKARARRGNIEARSRVLNPGVREYNPLGKLPGSVWTVPTQPLEVPPELGVDHFAAYPMEWPRRIIQGWTPIGICVECGEGRRPVTETQPQPGLTGELIETRRREPSETQWQQLTAFIRTHRELAGLSRSEVSQLVVGTPSGACWWWENTEAIRPPTPGNWRALKTALSLPDTWDVLMLDTYMRPSGQLTTGINGKVTGRHQTAGTTGLRSSSAVMGYSCGCPTPTAPTRPSVCLDPFGGTGTTALVAKALGRHGITIDLSADYCRLAEWRCNNPQQLAAALQVEKPDVIPLGQLSLFEEAT